MESPQTQIWGPELWMILHSSAERIGSAPLKRLSQEELRLWSGLLSSLRYSLPCPLCKKHYNDYYSAHPIQEVSKPFLRNWLFQLHSEINTRNNKPNNFTIDTIAEIYSKPFHFSRHVNIVVAQMRLAIFHNWCKREDIQRSIRFLEEMKRFYDFF
jgi:hypothetical protein